MVARMTKDPNCLPWECCVCYRQYLYVEEASDCCKETGLPDEIGVRRLKEASKCCPRCGADYEEAVREKILKNRLDEIKTWSFEKLVDYVQSNESELMKDMPLDLLLTFPEAEGVDG